MINFEASSNKKTVSFLYYSKLIYIRGYKKSNHRKVLDSTFPLNEKSENNFKIIHKYFDILKIQIV